MKIIKLILKTIAWMVAVVLFLILITVVALSFTKPSLNKNWNEDSKILPHVTVGTSSVSVENLRDWRYKPGEVISREYYEETFDLDKIEKVFLAFNPFGKWEGVGHFFFVFEFSDGKTVSVSAEARREEKEEYSAFRGVFNKYELWYAFGSTSDFFTRRAVYFGEDLYLYPLLIPKESVRALFVDMSRTAQSLENSPQFYNTVTSNCTNVLADAANRVQKGSVPWHISRLFTGYADNQLYGLGFIPHDRPFNQIYKEAQIDREILKFISENPNYSNDEFWNSISSSITKN